MSIITWNRLLTSNNFVTSPALLSRKHLKKLKHEDTINPIVLALASGYTFIVRSYAFDVSYLEETIKKAIQHHGMALVVIQQPCPIYNNINTEDWYSVEDRRDTATGKSVPRVYKLEETDFDGIVRRSEEMLQKSVAALIKSQEWGDRIPMGVFYQNGFVSTYQERIAHRMSGYHEAPPAKQVITNSE